MDKNPRRIEAVKSLKSLQYTPGFVRTGVERKASYGTEVLAATFFVTCLSVTRVRKG